MGRRADDVISSLESGVRLGGRSISPKFAGPERNAPASARAVSSESTSRRRSPSPMQACCRKASRSWAGRSSTAPKMSLTRCQRSACTGLLPPNECRRRLTAGSRRPGAVIGVLESPIQPRLRRLPFAIGRAEGNAHSLGGLFQGEAAKKAQLDQARLRLVERGELDQGCVEIEQVGIPRRDGGGVRSQRYPQAAATLASTARARVIHEDTPHQASRHREELLAVLPGGILRAQAKIRLVHQIGRIEGVTGPLVTEAERGPPPELAIDDGHQFVASRRVALSPGLEQAGHFPLRKAAGARGRHAAPPFTTLPCPPRIRQPLRFPSGLPKATRTLVPRIFTRIL